MARGDCASLPSLTDLIRAAEKIDAAWGGTDPIDVAIRNDAYEMADSRFSMAPGTVKRIGQMYKLAKRGWI